MKIGFTVVSNAVEKMHADLLKKSNKIDAALARDVTVMFHNAQRQRWMTEGRSEGKKWKALDKRYAKRKLTQYAAYPGGGRKMLIATNDLVKSVTGEDRTYYRQKVEGSKLTIGTAVPYAVYVDEERPFMEFSKKTMKKMLERITLYMLPEVSK